MNHRIHIALLLSAVACSSESAGPGPSAPVAAAEPTAADDAVADAPASGPAESEPPAAEPEPPPPANAEPATLELAAHGRCFNMGMSFLADQSFVHYGSRTIHLHRMGPSGGVEHSETFDKTIPVDYGYGELDGKTVMDVVGRWPDQVMLLVDFHDRETEVRKLFRRVDDDWVKVKTRTKTTDIKNAWPWYDDSILALSSEWDTRPPRLVVVRGQPKGRSLAPLRRKGRCENYMLDVQSLHPRDDGGLTLLAECNGEWMAHWEPGQEEGTFTRLGGDSQIAELMLDEASNGFIVLDDKVLTWQDGAAQPVPLPAPGKLKQAGRGPQGRPWIRQKKVVSEWDGQRWETITELPEGRMLTVHGVAERTPWVHRDKVKGQKAGVMMQTVDGQWHEVALSPVPDLDKVPRPTAVHVVGPGDVWVETVVFRMNKKGRNVGKRFHALYTTRPVPEPFACL